MTRMLASETDNKDIPEHRKRFAANFRKARQRAGMTQRDVCEAAEMTQPYLSEVERGLSNISYDSMEKLAAVVGQPLWKLLK